MDDNDACAAWALNLAVRMRLQGHQAFPIVLKRFADALTTGKVTIQHGDDTATAFWRWYLTE